MWGCSWIKADVYCGDVLRASGRIELLQYHATVVTVSQHGLDPQRQSKRWVQVWKAGQQLPTEMFSRDSCRHARKKHLEPEAGQGCFTLGMQQSGPGPPRQRPTLPDRISDAMWCGQEGQKIRAHSSQRWKWKGTVKVLLYDAEHAKAPEALMTLQLCAPFLSKGAEFTHLSVERTCPSHCCGSFDGMFMKINHWQCHKLWVLQVFI